MTEDDYTEEDRYDWDRNDDRQYCEHGTFIGSWWGPDLMCWACEEGISMEEFRLSCAVRSLTEIRRRMHQIWPFDDMNMYQMLGRWSHTVIEFLFRHAEENAEHMLDLMEKHDRLANEIEDLRILVEVEQ